jgi:predicted RNase H-like HicB family nuclease
MHNELMAIAEPDGLWYVAYCAEVPDANGQGKSREECLANLREAIALVRAKSTVHLSSAILRTP